MTRTDPLVSFDIRQRADGSDRRIMLFVKGFGPGGVERIALRLADGLRTAGLPIDLVAGSEFGPMEPPSGQYHVARVWPAIGSRAPIVRLTVSLWRQIRSSPPTILFCPGNAYTVIPVLLKLALGNTCPPIVAKISNDLQRHDLPPMIRPLYRLWLRLQGRAIDHFAVLSTPMASEVMTLMRVPPHRVHVMPNPVLDAADFEPDRRERQPTTGRRFVAVGRLERQKDYPAMLRAFARGAWPDDHLTIFGEGSERGALLALIAALGLADRVDLPGHCCNVRARLRDYDVLLLSSLYEGLPGAVVEALSVGLVIVATRCCVGIADMLDHGGLGTLVACGDVQGFAQAIAQVDPVRQDRARARAKVRDCTIEAAVPAYVALFATVIADRQAREAKMRKTSSFLRSGSSVKPA
ncbi:glycosyltransferase [Sphingobium sp.]|uniref:glycosyltransferase n=1 Tax=Sphingobium sp. TaxID=1912891 RepID=UPI003BB49264